MTDTKTHKQEALELLALETMTRKQRDWLDILTAFQAGHKEIVMQEGRYDSDLNAFSEAHQPGIITRLMDFDELWGYLNVPNYATSINDCYKLPIPRGHRWTLISPVEGSEYIVARASIDTGTPTKITRMPDAKTLPLAMLKCWWSIQPDSDHP